MTDEKYLPVVEVFGPTLQGEGSYAGKLVNFIRLGGCDYNCIWCDTKEARDKYVGQLQPIDHIIDQLYKNVTRIVVITGGNPAIHDLSALIDALHMRGFIIHLETQGSIYQPWMTTLDHITISPKGPSSCIDKTPNMDIMNMLLKLHIPTTLKFVIGTDEDLKFTTQLLKTLHKPIKANRVPIILQPCTQIGKADQLPKQCVDIFEKILYNTDREINLSEYDIRILPQMHVMYWGHTKGV